MRRIWKKHPHIEELETPTDIVTYYKWPGNSQHERVVRGLTEYYDSTHRASYVLKDFATEEQYWREMCASAEDLAVANPTRFAAITGYYTDVTERRLTMDTPIRLAFDMRYPDEYSIPYMNPDVTFADLEAELRAGRYPYNLLEANPGEDRGVTDTLVRDRIYYMWMEAKGFNRSEMEMYWDRCMAEGEKSKKKADAGKGGKKTTASQQRKPSSKTRKASSPQRKPKSKSTGVRR